LNNKLHLNIASIVAEVLNMEPNSMGNQLLRDQTPNWDSLKHMELILRLEEEFQVRFTSREVAEIQSLDDLIRLLEVKS
jgi:acyl carrier protein